MDMVGYSVKKRSDKLFTSGIIQWCKLWKYAWWTAPPKRCLPVHRYHLCSFFLTAFLVAVTPHLLWKNTNQLVQQQFLSCNRGNWIPIVYLSHFSVPELQQCTWSIPWDSANWKWPAFFFPHKRKFWADFSVLFLQCFSSSLHYSVLNSSATNAVFCESFFPQLDHISSTSLPQVKHLPCLILHGFPIVKPEQQ